MSGERTRRLADRIQQVVAQTLQSRVKDPRLGMVTVTDVRVTGDLREATVFYTAFGSAEERADSAVALASVTGLLRSNVGRVTGLKHTPSLAFVPDAIPENAAHLEDLLAAARESDAAVSRARVGAEYAGDPDPYRAPDDGAADQVDGPDAAAEVDGVDGPDAAAEVDGVDGPDAAAEVDGADEADGADVADAVDGAGDDRGDAGTPEPA